MSELSLSTEEYDLLNEDLTFLISPKLSVRSQTSQISNQSGNSNATGSTFNPKVSPIVTDDINLDGSQPALNSLRGYDEHNNPVYATSQTPHDYQVMTKRKVSKKSVFNFEGVDVAEVVKNKQLQQQQQQQQQQNQQNHPESGIAFPNSESGDGTNKSAINPFQFDGSNDNSVPQFLAGINWNSQNSQMHNDGGGDFVLEDEVEEEEEEDDDDDDEPQVRAVYMMPRNQNEPHQTMSIPMTLPPPPSSGHYLPPHPIIPSAPAVVDDPTVKNPRKKHGPESSIYEDQSQLQHQLQSQHHLQQQQQQQQQQYYSPPPPSQPVLISPATAAGIKIENVNNYHPQAIQSEYTDYANPISIGYHPTSQWVNYSPQLDFPHYSDQNNQTRPNEYTPNQGNFPFPLPVITISNANSPYQSSYESPERSNLMVQSPNGQNGHDSNSNNNNNSNHNNNDNYHAILQQKVAALKLNQTPNSADNRSHRATIKEEPISSPPQSQYNIDIGFEDEFSGGKSKSRASKSLAEISRRFVTLYGKDNTMDYISGLVDPDIITDPPVTLNRVDGAAEALGVHVRRIYELIKILEILSLVGFAGDKRGKFSWKGTKDFLFTLGSIQNDGIARFPKISQQIGLLEVGIEPTHYNPTQRLQNSNAFHTSTSKEDFRNSVSSLEGNELLTDLAWNDINQLFADTSPSFFDLENSLDLLNEDESFAHGNQQQTRPVQPTAQIEVTPIKSPPMKLPLSITPASNQQEEHFMVEIICKRFLQLFLVGMNLLSMSNVIQKLIPMGKNQTLNEYNKINATKIRRVYDVTNVLCSLNLIKKKSIPKLKAGKAELFNNIDDLDCQHSPFLSPSDHDNDYDDSDSRASSFSSLNTKKSGSTKAGSRPVSEKGDAKVLEWASFSPHIIRKKYLERIQENRK